MASFALLARQHLLMLSITHEFGMTILIAELAEDGGAWRNRTADLLHAMQTLYQLS